MDYLNPDSLKVLTGCKLEPSLAGAAPGANTSSSARVLLRRPGLEHRAAGFQPDGALRDTWAKIEAK